MCMINAYSDEIKTGIYKDTCCKPKTYETSLDNAFVCAIACVCVCVCVCFLIHILYFTQAQRSLEVSMRECSHHTYPLPILC